MATVQMGSGHFDFSREVDNDTTCFGTVSAASMEPHLLSPRTRCWTSVVSPYWCVVWLPAHSPARKPSLRPARHRFPALNSCHSEDALPMLRCQIREVCRAEQSPRSLFRYHCKTRFSAV